MLKYGAMNVDTLSRVKVYSGAELARPLSVLFLEPNDESAKASIEAFTRRGWLVNQAHTFMEALGLVQDRSFDVAIIEMMLPDVVGTDAWNYIRKLSPNTTGIITTSSPSLRASINPVEPGVISFLLKPFDVDLVGDLITQALENRQQVFKDQRIEKQLSGLSAVLSSVSLAPGSQVISTALAHIPAVLRADSVFAYELNEDKSLTLQWPEDYTPAQLEWIQSRSEFIQDLVARAIDTLQPIVIGVPREPERGQAVPLPFDVELGAVAIVPLIGETQTYGALAVIDKNDSEHSLAAAEVELIRIVAQSVALALDHAQSAKLALSERMPSQVGVSYARGYLERFVELEIARQKRYNRPFSFLLIDIVNLRQYDEMNGAKSRGETLQSVLTFTRRQLRGSDVIGCLTNKEIAILLPETDDAKAQMIANRLTQAIETRLSREIGGLQPELTTKVVKPPLEAKSLEDLLKPRKVKMRKHGQKRSQADASIES
jgi:diguanylate cyclase (GGDEF)-like protein